MQITIKFRDDVARQTEYFLQLYYKSKKSLNVLAKVAILEIAAKSAKQDLKKQEVD